MGENGDEGNQEGGLEGMGRWVGMQGTPTTLPCFTRLPFFSCCESKLQHINLLSPECTNQLEAGYDDDDDHDHDGYSDGKLGGVMVILMVTIVKHTACKMTPNGRKWG